jgi:competence protein ComEC
MNTIYDALVTQVLQYFIPAHRIGWRSPLVAGFCFAWW